MIKMNITNAGLSAVQFHYAQLISGQTLWVTGIITAFLLILAAVWIIYLKNRRQSAKLQMEQQRLRILREHEKMSDEINRQTELLKTVNNISSALLEPDIDHFEYTLKKSMGIMAEIASADRICIWRNSSPASREWFGRLRFSLVYQWEKNSFKTQEKNGMLSGDLVFDDFAYMNETLSNGKCINTLVSDMPPAEQAVLKERNIISIFVVPVFLEVHFWGFVGFDHCTKERIFEDSEVLILRSASRMLVNAVIRNEMAEELVQAKVLAEQSNRSKSIFLSHMSHEIRTPMNAILGIAEIQLRDETHAKTTIEAFSKIYESGDLLLNIINDILDLSKIESGKLEVVPLKYDIPSLINDTVQLNRLRYDSKQIQFSLSIDENTPADLFGDELRIKQILNNILSNAYKYTDKGKIEFSISAEYENEKSNNVTLVFSISDTGQGMNKGQLERLFDEYVRFNMEKNRTTVGAGLGMTISKRLIDLMNGTIEIKSEPGKGSLFVVRLPQKRIGTNVCGPELAETLQDFNFQSTTIAKKTRFLREHMPYGSVLVVDDVDSNIYVTKGMLLPYGLNIETVTSGLAAIEKVRNGSEYDIIFMDHMMPGMDGIETVKILREMGYTNPIIALTANALVGRAEMFMNNGFDGFISKPIDSRELNLFLNDFIRNRKSPEVVEAARREQNEKKAASQTAHTALAVQNTNETYPQDRDSQLEKLFIIDAQNALNILEYTNKKLSEIPDKQPAKNDIDSFVIAVHGMKSTLANLGEKELSAAAYKLEIAGDERNLDELAKATPVFMEALNSLIAKYKQEQGNSADKAMRSITEISDVDLDSLRGKLGEIKTSCAVFDNKTAKAALLELKQKTWPLPVNNLLDEITIGLLHSAFRKTESNIDDFLDKLL